MLVKELIKKLETLDPKMAVLAYSDEEENYLHHVCEVYVNSDEVVFQLLHGPNKGKQFNAVVLGVGGPVEERWLEND